jgi:hypothetical protein
VRKFVSKRQLSERLDALGDNVAELSQAVTGIESDLATVAANTKPGRDHRKPPRAWWAIVAIIPVALALAIAAAQFVYTKDAGSPLRVFADVIGAVLVVLSVVAQSVLVILDAWGVDESDRTRSITSIVSIVVGIVGGTFVAIGALNAHGA